MTKRILNRFRLIFYVRRLRSKRSADDAAFQLGSLGDRRAVAPLIAAVEDGSSLGATYALGVLGDRRAVGALVKALTANARVDECGYELASAAADALAKLGDRQAVAPLIQVLETTYNRCIKCHCCSALGELGDPAAIGALLQQYGKAPEVLMVVDQNDVILNAQEKATDVRRAAACTLQKLGHPIFVGDCPVCNGSRKVLRRSRRGVTDAMGLHGHVEHTEIEQCRRCSGKSKITLEDFLKEPFSLFLEWPPKEQR